MRSIARYAQKKLAIATAKGSRQSVAVVAPATLLLVLFFGSFARGGTLEIFQLDQLVLCRLTLLTPPWTHLPLRNQLLTCLLGVDELHKNHLAKGVEGNALFATEMGVNEVSVDQSCTYNEGELPHWPFARGPRLFQSAALALANTVVQVNSKARLVVVVNDCIAAVGDHPAVSSDSALLLTQHVIAVRRHQLHNVFAVIDEKVSNWKLVCRGHTLARMQFADRLRLEGGDDACDTVKIARPVAALWSRRAGTRPMDGAAVRGR